MKKKRVYFARKSILGEQSAIRGYVLLPRTHESA